MARAALVALYYRYASSRGLTVDPACLPGAVPVATGGSDPSLGSLLLESNLLLTVDIRRTAFYDNITMHEFVPPSVSFVDVHDTFVLRSCAAFHVHNNVLRSTLRSYEAIDTMSMVAVFAVYVSLARGSVLMIDNATVRVDWPPEGMMRIGRESLNATVLLLQPTGGTVGLPKQMDR